MHQVALPWMIHGAIADLFMNGLADGLHARIIREAARRTSQGGRPRRDAAGRSGRAGRGDARYGA